MISRDKLMRMLELQASMNAKVNPDWSKAGYPWLRAIVIEGAEAMEHYGWKWWKKQDKDVDQYGIELVDIWHFALSHAIVQARGVHAVAADNIMSALQSTYQSGGIMFDGNAYEYYHMSTLSRTELMIGLAVSNRFSFPLFATLLKDIDMDWDELYTGYVAKNVLNFFRQDHGYKAGTYIKMWAPGVEDNVTMFSLVSNMDTDAPDFAEQLRADLEARYASVLAQHGRLAEAARTDGA